TFSPVPFWDMWDGGLGFYVRQMTDVSQWWAQHNEHRIVLSRILGIPTFLKHQRHLLTHCFGQCT
ncbi:hypothetical protein QT713_22860, partial [Xanthomonas citri pv. citri]